MWSGSGRTFLPFTTTYSARPPWRCSPMSPKAAQSGSSPRRQYSQRAQVRFGFTATRSPTFTPPTPAPTSTTPPAISAPVQKGGGGVGRGNRHGKLPQLAGREVLLELRVELLVGGRAGGELLGVTDHQVLEFAVLGGVVGMDGETGDLHFAEAHPLTEG